MNEFSVSKHVVEVSFVREKTIKLFSSYDLIKLNPLILSVVKLKITKSIQLNLNPKDLEKKPKDIKYLLSFNLINEFTKEQEIISFISPMDSVGNEDISPLLKLMKDIFLQSRLNIFILLLYFTIIDS